MIFYFSGTGNSAWVARQLAEGQNEELLSIAVEIDKNKEYKLREGEKVGFVFPVYAWGPPEIVLRFIRRLKMTKPEYLFFVCTCGDDTGRTAQLFSSAVARKGWRCRHYRDKTVRKTYGAGETLYRQPLPHTALQLKERTPEGKTETAAALLCLLWEKADGMQYF